MNLIVFTWKVSIHEGCSPTKCQVLPPARPGRWHPVLLSMPTLGRTMVLSRDDIMEYHGISWNIMEYHGISWSIMEYHGISWNIMEYHGISYHHVHPCSTYFNHLQQRRFSLSRRKKIHGVIQWDMQRGFP